MITREQIEEKSKSPRITHHLDFCLSLGDTIREKFTSMRDSVTLSCLREVDSGKNAFMVASPEVGSGFSTMPDFDFNLSDEFILEEKLTYHGEYKHLCGSNGYESGFKLIVDDEFPKDLIMVWVEDAPATLYRIYHFVI